jgi:hypothetical protein
VCEFGFVKISKGFGGTLEISGFGAGWKMIAQFEGSENVFSASKSHNFCKCISPQYASLGTFL